MNSPSLLRSILVAFVLTLIGHFGFTLLPLMLPLATSLKLISALLAALYLAQLFRHAATQRIGLLSIAAFWLAASVLGWLLTPMHDVWSYALGQILLVWLIRSALCYRNVLSPIVDLALCGLSILLTLYTWHSTHNSFASLWVFFLSQSLCVLIPRTLPERFRRREATPQTLSPFDSALKSAEDALKLLR